MTKMATSREDIRQWLLRAQKSGASHVIVVCDTYDHEDYPINVMPDQNVHTIHDQYNGPNMQRVMEVYNFSLDIEAQLSENRAKNF